MHCKPVFVNLSGRLNPGNALLQRKTILSLHLLLICGSALHAGFDISIEPEAGFQTDVPDGRTDSTFNNYPFCALGLEPSWCGDIGNELHCILASRMNVTKYIGGSGEVSIAPKVSFEKKGATHATRADLGAAYYFTPAAYDPTLPKKYMEYSFECEREKTGTTTLTGMYAFFLLCELASSRLDFKNVLQFKINRQMLTNIDAYLKTGCTWNISNTQEAGYVQPLAATGITMAMDTNKMLVFQLFASYSFFNPSNVPVLVTIGRGRRGKKMDTLTTYSLSVPRIPFMSLYCGYDRELTSHTNIHFYYMPALFGRGKPHSLHLSHQTGIILSWRRQ